MAESTYVVAPFCSGWVAFVRAECSEEAAVRALMAMGTCQCDLKAARYVGSYRLHGRTLLGWTFETRGCKQQANG
jgi:hypothetical protein